MFFNTIFKMRLANQITRTILRFPSVDTEFESNQVYEFSPVYPDVQPTLSEFLQLLDAHRLLSRWQFPVLNGYSSSSIG